jgi:hypothetical protein
MVTIAVAAILVADGDDLIAPSDVRDVVEIYYSALNAGDAEAMARAWPNGDAAMFAVLADGVTQLVSTSCGPNLERTRVRCEDLVIRNDFYNPAGVSGSFTYDYRLAGGVIVGQDEVDRSVAFAEYQEAFGEWLADAHPDVYRAGYQPSGFPPFRTVDQARDALALIDEFLADSDAYPLSGN